jgi:Zn-dependent peptidase ImmA (M78 family)
MDLHRAMVGMEEMAIAHINAKIIPLALKRLNKGLDYLTTKSLPLEKIQALANGDHPPTETQAEFLANKLRIPYLVLFLDDPPNLDDIPLPDLRTLSGERIAKPSVDFVDTVNAALLRQDWFREYQVLNRASPLPFVGKYSIKDPVKRVAEDLRSTLGLTPEFRQKCASWTDFLRFSIRQAESSGILVMRNGVVEHSTRRRLSIKEFRGFAVSDPLAPLVFINDSDARAAQNFTLAHELAHIWIGQSGISNSPINRRNVVPMEIERYCNHVAAELLAPEEEARRLWRSSLPLNTNIEQWTHSFRVSKLMALLRAYELGFLNYADYRAESDKEWERIKKEEELRKKREQDQQKKRKGDFWATFKLRTSDLFNRALADGVRREFATYTEASSLLGVHLCTVEEFMRKESA